MRVLFATVLAATLTVPAATHSFSDQVPMFQLGSSTFYIEGHIEGVGRASLLVDTGSSYTALNGETFSLIEQQGNAHYVKKLNGIMADGSRRVISIYRIPGITLGDKCHIRDLEVAVFPNKTRLILGLNALRKVAPFTLMLEESPRLMLNNCRPPVALTATDTANI